MWTQGSEIQKFKIMLKA